jgi:two-component system sensor histidine kinase DesK
LPHTHRPATAPQREDGPADPTGLLTYPAAPTAAEDFWRKRIAINVSFLWLLYPILDLAGSHPTALRAVVVAVAVLVFVVVYNGLPRRPAQVHRTLVVGASLAVLTLIATALTLADRSSWALLFVFTAIAGAMRLPRRDAVVWIFCCTLLTALVSTAASPDTGSTISLSATTLAISFMMFYFRRLTELNRDLVRAREELARLAVSEERLRFARDLHDLLGHGLTVISVKAELAERLLARDAAAAAQHVTDIKIVARNALSDVRDAVSAYHQPTLEGELTGARMALQAAGIHAHLRSTEQTLDPQVEALLAWAIREGTTNVIRHSGARNCRIDVQPGPTAVSAEVVDDGHAVEPNGSGNGLAGLRERAERLAGTLEAGPAPGGGFRLSVSVPVGGPAT